MNGYNIADAMSTSSSGVRPTCLELHVTWRSPVSWASLSPGLSALTRFHAPRGVGAATLSYKDGSLGRVDA